MQLEFEHYRLYIMIFSYQELINEMPRNFREVKS